MKLNKLLAQLDKKMPTVIVVPKQTVFRVSVMDREIMSCSSMVNNDSLQIEMDDGFLVLKFKECIGNTQYISLYFTKEPLYQGGSYDS